MKQRKIAPLLLAGLVSLPAQAEPTPVSTATLGQNSYFKTHSAPATTLTLNRSHISAEIQGRIQRILVRVGDPVYSGTPLAELDCRENQLRLRQTEAALEAVSARVTLARQQIERTTSLRKQRNVSEERLNQQQADLKRARADYAAQQATIEQARLNVERCSIMAPFSGIITARDIGEGSWINPGQALFQLVDSQRLEVSAQIPLDLIDSLGQAEKIELQTNNNRFKVHLRNLVAVVASRGRNREARLEFAGQGALPGTTGRLEWHSRRRYVAADIPVRRGDRLGLFLLDGGLARFHPLPEAREGQPARVELPETTQLIIDGRYGLKDGDPVKVVGPANSQ